MTCNHQTLRSNSGTRARYAPYFTFHVLQVHNGSDYPSMAQQQQQLNSSITSFYVGS